MKKSLSLCLAVALLLALVPAAVQADAAPTVITVLAPYFNSYDASETRVQQEYEKIVSGIVGQDIAIEYTLYGWATEFREKLNMAVNAADIAWDIVGISGLAGSDGTFQGNASLINGYGQSGMFACLSDYDTPNLDYLLGECGSLIAYMFDAEGKIYFSPMFSENQGGTFSPNSGIVIDKTVFDANGIAYPTTADELYEAALKLKELYPDVNVFIPSSGGAVSLEGNFSEQLFATRYNGNLGFNGTEYVMEGVTDNYRACLSYANKFYEAGLVAEDYAAWDGEMVKAAKANGQGFIFGGQYMQAGNILSGGIQFEDHEYLLISYALAVNEGGWWGMRGAMTKYSANTWGSCAVNAMSKNVDLAVKVLDASLSEEAHNVLALGFEGETYEINEDGYKVFIGDYRTASGSTAAENPKMAIGLSMNGACMTGLFPAFGVTNTAGFGENSYFYQLTPEGEVVNANPYLFGQEHWDYAYMEPENSVDVSLPAITPEEYATVVEIKEPLATYISECLAKFITGELDVNDDAVWENYLTECYKYDIDGMCGIYNKYIEGVKMYNID